MEKCWTKSLKKVCVDDVRFLNSFREKDKKICQTSRFFKMTWILLKKSKTEEQAVRIHSTSRGFFIPQCCITSAQNKLCKCVSRGLQWPNRANLDRDYCNSSPCITLHLLVRKQSLYWEEKKNSKRNSHSILWGNFSSIPFKIRNIRVICIWAKSH